MKLFLPGGEEGGGRGRGYGPRLDCLTTPFVTKENSFSSALVSYGRTVRTLVQYSICIEKSSKNFFAVLL